MFLFGPKKTQPKKIDSDFEDRVKNCVKSKLCPLCGKLQSTKIAFGEQVQPTLSCNNCELKAVGNVIQKLGVKNLIPSQKFANALTHQLIVYQKSQGEPTVSHKQCPDLVQSLDKQVKQISTSIQSELHTMKELSKAKVEQLGSEADKQNVMPIFDDTLKLYSQKKAVGPQFMNQAIKRSQVGTKGVHFVDQQQLESRNASIDQRFQSLKKQTKLKLKNINSLIDQIENLSLE